MTREDAEKIAARAAEWIDSRGPFLTPPGGISPVPPGSQIDLRVVYAYADGFAQALVALVEEGA